MMRPKTKIRVLVLHGPNLNLLGERQPEIYGSMSLRKLNSHLRDHVKIKCELRIKQSNGEGELIDWIHANRKWANAIIINPAAYTHYSYAIRDALVAVSLPTYEVHLSDIHSREDFRKVSVICEACVAQISGRGVRSYTDALDLILASMKQLPRTRKSVTKHGWK